MDWPDRGAPIVDRAAIESEIAATRYRPAEVETIARLLLRDHASKVVAGDWWAYAPESGTVVYPARLLTEWDGLRIVGGICHEVAEAMYAGSGAAQALLAFPAAAARFGVEAASASLLLNVVNDLRVNTRYIAEYPGAATFLRSLYLARTDLHPKTDVRGRQRGRDPLPHHYFLDAVLDRWLRTIWPDLVREGNAQASTAVAVWPRIEEAIASESIAACAERLLAVLPMYGEVVARSRSQLEREAREAEPAAESEPGPAERDDEDGDDAREELSGETEPSEDGVADAGVYFFVRDDAPIGSESASESDDDERPTGRRDGPPAGVTPPPLNRESLSSGPRWVGGVIQRIRRFKPRGGVDYEQFNYVRKVHELDPLIDATVNGRGGAPGLAQILMLRRFGTTDPFRRPRRFRRGDTGEIDEDRTENLLIDPAVAFLRGARQRRDDSLKDFANAILLDVSGSVVQRGYPSRKFDQVVDTAVLFIEIHERLKLPYEVIAFSETPRVLRSFAETASDTSRLEPASRYIVRDLSYLVREMYTLDHGETREATALQMALSDIESQGGLKTILMVTDGISSDREALVDAIVGIDERNRPRPPATQLALLAFGVGLAEGQFKASYEPSLDGATVACSRGTLVPRIEALPDIICRAVERRILGSDADAG